MRIIWGENWDFDLELSQWEMGIINQGKWGSKFFGPIPFRVPESSQFEALTPGPVSSVKCATIQFANPPTPLAPGGARQRRNYKQQGARSKK